jgi:hypothetical protein
VATGSVALEKLQGRIEVTEGAGGTATRVLSIGPGGGVDHSNVQKRVTIEDRRAAGTRTSLRNTYSGIESSVLTISSIPVSYQDFGWWMTLLAPTGGGVPGTVDTTARTRTFTPVEGTAVNTYGTGFYTAFLEFSALDFSATMVRKMPAMRVTNLTLNWSKRASGTDTGFTMDVELSMGQSTATNGTSFSTALSAGTPTLAIGNQLISYVDTSTIGTTGDTDIMSARFQLVNPLTFHDGMDGQNGHTSAHHALQWTPTMTLTAKFSDLTELNAYVARTTRKVRIASVGDVVGATTATNLIRFDFIGSPVDHRITAVDGLWYSEIDLEGIYDDTLTTSWAAYLQNASTAAYTAT